MAHFAHVVNGVVVKVHVVANEVITVDGVESEELGQQFLAELYGYVPDEVVQCSYNSNMRNTYPGVGFTYDPVSDVFISPKPFESWVLNDAFQWEGPIPYPSKGEWVWDEQSGAWVKA